MKRFISRRIEDDEPKQTYTRMEQFCIKIRNCKTQYWQFGENSLEVGNFGKLFECFWLKIQISNSILSKKTKFKRKFFDFKQNVLILSEQSRNENGKGSEKIFIDFKKRITSAKKSL